MFKLSIITINLNNKAGLEKTINSVIQQTYTNFEYIIIDGGSDDGSVDIIKKNEEKISYWVSEHDSGIYNAMNKGIKNATGEYCLFLNSGDLIYDNFVLQQIFNTEYTDDFIYGNLEINCDNNKWIGFAPPLITLHHLLKDTLWHPSTFIKRKLFEEIGKYDESFKIAGDYEFFLRGIVVNNKTAKYINLVVATFNMNGISSQNDNAFVVKHERERAQRQNINTDIIEIFNDMNSQIENIQCQNKILNKNYLEVLNSRPVRLAKFIKKIIHFRFF